MTPLQVPLFLSQYDDFLIDSYTGDFVFRINDAKTVVTPAQMAEVHPALPIAATCIAKRAERTRTTAYVQWLHDCVEYWSRPVWPSFPLSNLKIHTVTSLELIAGGTLVNVGFDFFETETIEPGVQMAFLFTKGIRNHVPLEEFDTLFAGAAKPLQTLHAMGVSDPAECAELVFRSSPTNPDIAVDTSGLTFD